MKPCIMHDYAVRINFGHRVFYFIFQPPVGPTSAVAKSTAPTKQQMQSSGRVFATVLPPTTTTQPRTATSRVASTREKETTCVSSSATEKGDTVEKTDESAVETKDSKNANSFTSNHRLSAENQSLASSEDPEAPQVSLDDETGVFVDANYHVMYKEYNLRRSKTFLTTVGKEDTGTAKDTPEKRQRSPTGSDGEQAAMKKFKSDKDMIVEKKPIVTKEALVDENNKVNREKTSEDKAKTSTPKTGKIRKPSLSQSKKSHRKKQAAVRASGTDPSQEEVEMVCCLCSRKDSYKNLGFLYGPYKPTPTNEDRLKSPDTTTVTAGGGEEGGGGTDAVSLWVHDECAVWAPGVCIVKGKLLGLHEAADDGKKLVSVCTCVCAVEPLSQVPPSRR